MAQDLRPFRAGEDSLTLWCRGRYIVRAMTLTSRVTTLGLILGLLLPGLPGASAT
jgi:hypothetical protein